MRLISDNFSPVTPSLIRSFEDSTERLREALAILVMIDTGSLLEELPIGPGRERHQCAISLLRVLRREIEAIADHQTELLDTPGG